MRIDVVTMWRAIEDAAIFDEDNKDDNNEDDLIPKAKVGGRRGKAKSACRKKRTRCGDEEIVQTILIHIITLDFL